MHLIEELQPYKSLSIIGMEKNTGKTTCLNYLLHQFKEKNRKIAITSIGIDGEQTDLVTQTQKPEIEIFEGMGFVTSEYFYHKKKLTAEIIDISQRSTSHGRLVFAKAITSGKVILSGPNTTVWLKQVMEQLYAQDFDFVITDGALSRKSLASPTLSESLILTTGAVLTPVLSELVRKTKFAYQLAQIEEFKTNLKAEIENFETGIYALTENEYIDLKIPSSLLLDAYKNELFIHGNTLYVTGIITNSLLNTLKIHKEVKNTTLVAKDFTKIFVDKDVLNHYLRAGGKLKVLNKNKLVAICVNPVSPQGSHIDSKKLVEALQKEIEVPVYDVKQFSHCS
ncbi:MAG: hypothetical protein FWC34_08055 [Bacteroidetes bacterium]|nr:hypothetical protein [Bacteroidota bacterium]MCL2301653.1 hypothetical protein [Lentimicrobiaceae bacterium]